MEQLESSYNQSTATNRGYNVEGALAIRLETTKIIENVEMFLRGATMVVLQDKEGQVYTKMQETGKPKANPLGIQSILAWLQLILNPQTVQGNFPVDGQGYSKMYEDYIYYVRTDLAGMVVINCYNWEIIDPDIDVIIDSTMNAIEPFMTRLIGNKERESYDNTVKHIEHNTLKEGRRGLDLFGGNQ